MNKLRIIYRNVLVETLLLAVIVIQIISGIKVFKNLKKIGLSRVEKLQSLTGFYMAIFLIIHVSAVMTGRYILKLDTNFYFGVAGINSFPLNIFFIPYYGLGIISWFGHIACIHYRKMKYSLLGLSPKSQSLVLFIVGIFLTVLIFKGLTNDFRGYKIPTEYELKF